MLVVNTCRYQKFRVLENFSKLSQFFSLRKLLAITLLSIHLFNLTGYSFLFKYLIQQSDHEFARNTEHRHYGESDVMLVKIPMHLPYYGNWGHYEKVEGELEVNGIHYNYVKRKIDNDTVYLVCLPNQAKTQLYKDNVDYTKLLNDIPSGKKTGQSNLKKSFASEYNSRTVQYCFASGVITLQQKHYLETSCLADGHASEAYLPPDLIL